MNEIAAFVGPRDVAALDRASLAAAGLADGMADIASVADAFERLRAAHPESVRVANPAFAGTGRR
ncbi:hypothetical protein [Collinsella bouchesdurhonensis]|uniref:hypothetical protein n=1 Tax=Collinsella bouchesdurhonensis TaxID=1907654 RepID=UPI0015F2B3F2|nr:hypothetical protein [Collinsella bouchesdurhonensis]